MNRYDTGLKRKGSSLEKEKEVPEKLNSKKQQKTTVKRA
jgi:hypothetical protein